MGLTPKINNRYQSIEYNSLNEFSIDDTYEFDGVKQILILAKWKVNFPSHYSSLNPLWTWIDGGISASMIRDGGASNVAIGLFTNTVDDWALPTSVLQGNKNNAVYDTRGDYILDSIEYDENSGTYIAVGAFVGAIGTFGRIKNIEMFINFMLPKGSTLTRLA